MPVIDPNAPVIKRPSRANPTSDVEQQALKRLEKRGKLDRVKKTAQDISDLQSVENRLVRSIATDIYPIPDVIDEARREATKYDFRLFNETYLSARFNLRWASTHLQSMEIMQNAVLRGDGQYSFADPRGSGKTSLAEALAMWCLFHAHRRYVVILGATAAHSIEIFKSITIEIEANQLFLEDFPEICYPIIMLGGSNLRCRFQHIQGHHTRIELCKDALVFPDIPGSKSAGSTIKCTSITGRVRGMKRTTASGESIRPDFLIIDDPQTDQSAKSPRMTEQRERVILNAVKGLAGPRKSLTAVMPCTVIASNDLAERFLDNIKRPEWQGKRNKLMNQFPTNMELWQQYGVIRKESFRKRLGGKLATDFYRENQVEMDKGAVVTWAERFDPLTQISAIQFAMDLFLDDPEAFASEYQNEPLILSNLAEGRVALYAKDILERYSGYPTGVVPGNTQYITAGVDIQQRILYYVIVAWVPNFGGVIIERDTYPKQTQTYFHSTNPPVPLEAAHPELAGTLPPQIYRALSHLQNSTFSRKFRRDESRTDYLSCDKVCIDKNWNLVTDAVEIFCKENETRNVYVPSVGKGIGPAMLPMEDWTVKGTEKPGNNWRYRLTQSGRGRFVLYESNYWKSQVAERLLSPKGNSNALLLYGDEKVDHKLLADHLSAEYADTTFGRGRSVDVWKAHVSNPENHYFDCLVQAAVAASMLGLEVHDKVVNGSTMGSRQKKPRRVITTADYKKA